MAPAVIYCTACGSPNPAAEVVCQVCGAALPRTGAAQATPPRPAPGPAGPAHPPRVPVPPPGAGGSDDLSGGEKLALFLGNACLSPLLGVVLYFVWKGRHPRRAAQVCTLTWWAVGLYVVLFLVMMVFGMLAQLSGA